MEAVDAEDSLEARQRRELKDLQAKIQSLKHGVPKGDKKRKKQVMIDIAKLEAELEDKHRTELQQSTLLKRDDESEAPPADQVASFVVDDERAACPVAVTKTQKRKAKREAQEKERTRRIAEGEKEVEGHARNVEAAKFDSLLKQRNLTIEEVSPDGNCLYNAVLVHLKKRTPNIDVSQLREKTSDFMMAHRDEFLPFTVSQQTGHVMTYDEFACYCQEVKETSCWGGQLELRAISQLFKVPIEIYLADAPMITIGEEFSHSPAICLSYHRHQYGLGEHYNSVLVADA